MQNLPGNIHQSSITALQRWTLLYTHQGSPVLRAILVHPRDYNYNMRASKAKVIIRVKEVYKVNAELQAESQIRSELEDWELVKIPQENPDTDEN